jgi:Tol biopolymer transport system component
VYRARDPKLDREIALKLLPADDPGAATLEEGQLLARVHHPNVVTIFGADRHGAHLGLWMELVRGSTLEQVLKSEGPFDAERVAALGEQLCAALSAVHAAGLVHRDVKAQNVMLAAQERLVLMDFGTGRCVVTDETDIAGTPLYLAPEIFAGQPATVRSDLYSVGVLLHHLLTARYPCEGRTLADVRAQHRAGSVVGDVRRLRPDVPRRLTSVIAKALDADPLRRYESASAMGSALAAGRPAAAAFTRRMLLSASAAALVAMTATTIGRRFLASGWWQSGSAAGGVVPPGSNAHRLTLPDAGLWGAGLSFDGRTFSYATSNGSVATFDLHTRKTDVLVAATDPEFAEFAITSPDGRFVAYQWCTVGQRYEVRLVDRNTRSVRVLINDYDLDSPLPVEWSRDGRQILIWGRTRARIGHMLLVDTDTNGSHLVRTFADDGPLGLSLSPDSRFVVYDLPSSAGALSRCLRIIASDGSADHQLLPEGESDERFPLWTPDGTRIFFISDRSGTPDGWLIPVHDGHSDGDPTLVLRNLAGVTSFGFTQAASFYYRVRTGAFEVYELALDAAGTAASSKPQRIATRFNGANTGPSYSPDGRFLAYISVRDGLGADRRNVLIIRDLTGASDRELHSPVRLDMASAKWSPDGRQLLVRGEEQQGSPGIFVIDAATGAIEHRVVTFNPSEVSDYAPMAWSPVPEAIVYGHAPRGLVWHSLTDGSERVLYGYSATSPTRRIHRFQFSPDGQLLAISATSRDGSASVLVVVTGNRVQELARRSSREMIVLHAWSGDGAYIYFTAPDVTAPPPHQLWRVAASGGESERLDISIPGATQFNGVVLSAARSTIAYTGGFPGAEIWIREGFLP